MPTNVRAFNRLLSELPSDLTDFAFVDYGSGKGKALLLASHQNFKQVIGVEYGRELNTVAERNIETYKTRRQKCEQINSICADAVEFPVPESNLVLYIFNPFGPEVLASVIKKLEASYRASPRKIIVIYENPKFRELFDQLDFLKIRPLRRLNLRSWLPPQFKFVIYESK